MKHYYTKSPEPSAMAPFNYIVIRHGETGYYPMPYLADDEIIADMNDHAGNSPAQIEAAILCSMFDCWQNFDKITAGNEAKATS